MQTDELTPSSFNADADIFSATAMSSLDINSTTGGGKGGVGNVKNGTDNNIKGNLSNNNNKGNNTNDKKKHWQNAHNHQTSTPPPPNANGGKQHGRPNRPGGGGSRKESRKASDFSISDILQSENRNKRGEISISHLLDIVPDHRERDQQRTRRRGGASGARGDSGYHHNYKNNNNGSSSSYLDKISYINMTCRFVLVPGINYKMLLNDPDSHVPMENVLRVICQPATCPICLESIPEAPRMLECGHLICYPCLFRYLAAESVPKPGEPTSSTPSKPAKYKECPLCFERIRLDKVKPVSLVESIDERFDVPKINHEAILRLMFRPNDSLLSVPKGTTGIKSRDFYDLPSISSPEICQCSRLIKGSLKYAVNEFEREIVELKKSREQNKLMYRDDGYWYTEAISMIKEMIKLYSEGETTTMAAVKKGKDKLGIKGSVVGSGTGTSSGSDNNGTMSPYHHHSGQSTPQVYKIGDFHVEGNIPLGSFTEIVDSVEQSAANVPVEESILVEPLADLTLDSEEVTTITPAPTAPTPTSTNMNNDDSFYNRFEDDSAFFFFQTGGLESLTKFFLAPLDIRILKKTFGTYSNFPAVLVARVDNVLYGTSVNDELRKRMKYLGHLPSQTPIGFLECDWRRIVPDEVLKSFTKELQLRRKRKQDKERREDRDQKRVQREEEEQFRHDLLQESYYYATPPMTVSTTVTGTSSSSPPSPSIFAGSPNPLVSAGDSSSNSSGAWGNNKASFAQAAATGKSEQDGRVINEILNEAEHSRKGRKKLILMSNRH